METAYCAERAGRGKTVAGRLQPMRGFASLWRHGGFGLIAMLALLALAILGFAVGVFGDTSAKESPALVGEAAGGALLGALATGLVGLIRRLDAAA